MSKASDKEFELLARRAELRAQGTDHPPVERLAACRAGRLPESEADEMREHLAVCRDCTRAYLELPRFGRKAEKRLRWQRFFARLEWRPAASPLPVHGERRSRNEEPPGGVERRRHLVPVPVALYGLAAGLVGCFAGIPVGYVSHQQKPRQAVVAQMIGSDRFRGAEPEKPLELAPSGPGGASTLVWQLPEEWDPKASYRVEIQNRAGVTLLLAETGPTPLAAPPRPSSGSASPPRNVAVEIPLKQLAPGDYRLVLSGGPPGEEPIEQPLRVLAPPAQV